MANDSSDYDALKRQLHGHLRSLRAAGVEWLPLGPPLDATPDAPTESEPELVRQLSLLDDAEPPAPALTLTIEQRRHGFQPVANEPVAGQAARQVPRLPRHPGTLHLSPGVPAAAPQPGEEARRVGRYEAAAGADGQAGAGADALRIRPGGRICNPSG